MLKFLIILILILYLIFRVGGFFFRMLFMGSQQQQHYQRDYRQASHRTSPNSNVKVDYVPDRDRKDHKDFNGGQYVDYEEVK